VCLVGYLKKKYIVKYYTCYSKALNYFLCVMILLIFLCLNVCIVFFGLLVYHITLQCFISITDKHQHMHFFTFKIVLV